MPKTSLLSSSLGPSRQILSLLASRFFEKSGIKRFFGLNLLAAVFVAGVVSPQASDLLSQLTIENKTPTTQITANPVTKTTFEIPLPNFAISQLYSFWHPGLDMAAPEGTPIYAIDDGVVEFAGTFFFGFGRHVVLSHRHNIRSLYAHMSEIDTVIGRRVARGELIGRVGATGWATGPHLHFEVYQNGVTINPLDVLPIKLSEATYDGALGQAPTSPPATPLPQVSLVK
jgi:murein DD-endopeptidase MepM/ murein hydrolase activator NlpD